MHHDHHNDTLYSRPKLISLLCISWENDTHLDGKVSWIGCLYSIILLVGCFSAACATVTQSGNLTPNRRPRCNDVCWTGDGVVAIYGGSLRLIGFGHPVIPAVICNACSRHTRAVWYNIYNGLFQP